MARFVAFLLSRTLRNSLPARSEVITVMRFGPFLAIALLLFILWIGGFVVFHVASGLIHLLLLIALISLILHLFTGGTRTV